MYWSQFLTHQSANPTYIRTFHCGPMDNECDFLCKCWHWKYFYGLVIPGSEILRYWALKCLAWTDEGGGDKTALSFANKSSVQQLSTEW